MYAITARYTASGWIVRSNTGHAPDARTRESYRPELPTGTDNARAAMMSHAAKYQDLARMITDYRLVVGTDPVNPDCYIGLWIAL